MYTYEYYGKPLYVPGDKDLYLMSPVINMGKNLSWTTSAKIRNNHPLFNMIKPLKYGLIIKKEGKIISKLRITKFKQVFNNIYSMYAEDKLASLNSSHCRPHNFQGSPEELFTWFIENHNMQLDDEQKFKKGIVNITDPNDYISRSWEEGDNTWNLINSRLIKPLGGFLVVRYEEDGDYLDWLSEYPETSNQSISFGKNLIDINKIIDASETYTACVPYGARSEAGVRLTIESVNEGKDYLINSKLAEEYGIIYAPTKLVTWDDVTRPENLLAKAGAWLNSEGVMLKESVDLSSLDLATVSADTKSFEMYQKVSVISEPHGIEAIYSIEKMKIAADLSEVLKITIGSSRRTLSSQLKNNREDTDRFKQIVEKINADYVTNEKVTQVVDSALTGPNAAIENLEQIAGDNSQDISSLKEGLANTDAHLSNEIERVTTAMESSIEQSADNISLEVATKYATKDEVATERSRVDILSDQVSVKIKTIEDVESFMTFNDDGNLIIGKSDSEIKSVQDNDSYQFVDKSGNSLLEINTKGVNSPTVNVEKQVTYFSQWAMRKGAYVNGAGYNLNDVWIGG